MDIGTVSNRVCLMGEALVTFSGMRPRLLVATGRNLVGSKGKPAGFKPQRLLPFKTSVWLDGSKPGSWSLETICWLQIWSPPFNRCQKPCICVHLWPMSRYSTVYYGASTSFDAPPCWTSTALSCISVAKHCELTYRRLCSHNYKGDFCDPDLIRLWQIINCFSFRLDCLITVLAPLGCLDL